MNPAYKRRRLLYQITNQKTLSNATKPEGIPVEAEFAQKHIFPDISIAAWVREHGLKCTDEIIFDKEKKRTYHFITFEFDDACL